MRFIFSILALLVFSPGANASVYDINLSNVWTTGQLTGPCYCEQVTGYVSPIYTFHAGDTANFGSITTFPIQAYEGPDFACCYTGPPLPDVYVTFGVNEDLNPLLFPLAPYSYSVPFPNGITYCDPGIACAPPQTIDLVYSFDSTTQFQIEFANATYTPPVPEPATWAMVLIGFALIGFASRYRTVTWGSRF